MNGRAWPVLALVLLVLVAALAAGHAAARPGAELVPPARIGAGR